MIGLIIGIILGALLLLFFVSIIVLEVSYHKTLYKRADGDLRIKYVYSYDDVIREKISFKNKSNASLNGYIYKDQNNNNPKALILMVHGIGYGHYYLMPMIRFLVKNGFYVLAYDQYGSGLSEGKYITSTVRGISDIEYAFKFIKENDSINKLPLYLFGHSWGGYVVINSLNIKDNNVKKIISVAGFNNDNDLSISFSKAAKLLSWAIYLRNFVRFGKLAFYSSKKSLLKNSSAKVLYLQGEEDNIVPVTMSGAKFKEIESKNNLLRVEMIPDKGHAPYVTIKAQNAQNEVMKELGLFGGALSNFNKNIDYEKLSELDPKVLQIILDFYNE